MVNRLPNLSAHESRREEFERHFAASKTQGAVLTFMSALATLMGAEKPQ